MLKRLIDFETAAAPDAAATGGDPAGGTPSPDAAAPPAAAAPDEGVPPAPVTEPAPPAGLADDPRLAELVDERALALLEQRLGPITQLLEGALVGDQGGEQTPQLPEVELDPLSEDFGAQLSQLLLASQQQLLAQIEQRLAGVTQPFEQAQIAAATAEGEARIADIIAEEQTRNGDLSAEASALIKPIAETLVPAIAARYGDTPRAAELALYRAAEQVRAIEAAAEKRGAERRENELKTLAGAGREVEGQGALGAQGLPEARNLSEVTQRYAERAREIRATGASV